MAEPTYRIDELPGLLASQIAISPHTGCWLWTGRKQKNGYGRIYWDKRMRVVHRVVYTLLVEPIPEGLVLDHVHDRGCRHRLCCWPAHLEAVTVGENNRRGRIVARLR